MAKIKEIKIKLTEDEVKQFDQWLEAMGYIYAIKKTGATYNRAGFIRDLLKCKKIVSRDRQYAGFRIKLNDRANIDQIKNL
jgi:hypothetical protein